MGRPKKIDSTRFCIFRNDFHCTPIQSDAILAWTLQAVYAGHDSIGFPLVSELV